jgi:hypothetical protein
VTQRPPSVLDAVLWRALPVRNPGQLLTIWARDQQKRPDQVTWTEYGAIAERAHGLSDVFAQSRHVATVKLPDRTELSLTSYVSDNYFDALGVTAVVGTVFHAKAGRDGEVVISHRYWQRALSGDPAVLDHPLRVNDVDLRVVGVLSPGFSGPNRGLAVDLFVPMQTATGILHQASLQNGRSPEFELLGRLKTGVEPERVRQDVESALRLVDKDGASPGPGRTALVSKLDGSDQPASRSTSALFAGIVLLILLVALIGTVLPFQDALSVKVTPNQASHGSTRRSRWLPALVVLQVAFVTGIVCVAVLLYQSLLNVSAIRPAMDPDRPLVLASGFWDSAEQATTRAASLADRLGAVPGVRRVAFARRALLSGSGGGAIVPVEFAGQPPLSFRYNQVSPEYFAATGARVLRGRSFTPGDGAAATLVVMVNEAFARRFFGGGPQAIGSWVRTAGAERQVVGIVEDGPTNHLREAIEPYLYFPFAQRPSGSVTFFVETTGGPANMVSAVRAQLSAADASYTPMAIQTMGDHMHAARIEESLTASMAGGLSALGSPRLSSRRSAPPASIRSWRCGRTSGSGPQATLLPAGLRARSRSGGRRRRQSGSRPRRPSRAAPRGRRGRPRPSSAPGSA